MAATRLDRWVCPLCGWSADIRDRELVWQHGRSAHPAELPARMTVLEALRLIPALVAEVQATLRAPNPAGMPARRARIDSPAIPGGLRGLVWLDPFRRVSDDPRAPLSLLVECSRICWEAVPAGVRAAHPQPEGAPTFASEARWLARLWPDAPAWLDDCATAGASEQVQHLVVQLAQAVRMSPPGRFRCPDCDANMHPAAGDWMLCEAGHWHPGPRRLRDQWRRRPPMPTADLAEALHMPVGTIHRWHHERRISPARRDGRQLWWLPWDVISLRYPGIAAEIDTAATPLTSSA